MKNQSSDIKYVLLEFDNDKCYASCEINKKECEMAFSQNMKSICASMNDTFGVNGAAEGCDEFTFLFLFAVDNFGGSAFESAQDDFCLWGDCYECSK